MLRTDMVPFRSSAQHLAKTATGGLRRGETNGSDLKEMPRVPKDRGNRAAGATVFHSDLAVSIIILVITNINLGDFP